MHRIDWSTEPSRELRLCIESPRRRVCCDGEVLTFLPNLGAPDGVGGGGIFLRIDPELLYDAIDRVSEFVLVLSALSVAGASWVMFVNAGLEFRLGVLDTVAYPGVPLTVLLVGVFGRCA